jgi:hypothetical protein
MITRILRIVLAAVSLTFLWSSGFLKAETMYEWKDAEGNVHFTDDVGQVPPAFRDKVKELSLPEASPPGAGVQAPPPPVPLDETPAESPAPAEDAYTECQHELQKEKDRLSQQLADDQARLAEVNRSMHLTATTRFLSELRTERAALRDRIAEAQRIQQEVFPQKEWECQRKRVLLPQPSP